MDDQLFCSYVDMLRRHAAMTFGDPEFPLGIYIHNISDDLPALTYESTKVWLVNSSVLLKLDCGNWVFMSNFKVGLQDPSVYLYCSNNHSFMYPALCTG